MTGREDLTRKLLLSKLSTAKIGVFVKGYKDINPAAIVEALAAEIGVHLYAAIVGYGAVPRTDAKLTISDRIEDAVKWRSIQEYAGRILVIVNGDTEKQHSLQELDLVTMRELTIAMVNEEKAAQSNVPTMKFWDALIAQSSYYKFEAVERFIKTVHSKGTVGTAIPSSLWCLSLLRDDSILESRCNPELALADNRRLIADAGQLSAEATKRLSSWLVHAKADEREELQKKYNLLQKYIEFGENKYLQDLDFATVKKFLSVSKKAEPAPLGPADHRLAPEGNQPLKIRDIDSDLIEALFHGDQERIKDIQNLFDAAEERMRSEDSGSENTLSMDGGAYDGQEVECPNNKTPLRKLVGRVCNESAWGGILKTEETVLKDAVSSIENEFHPMNPSDVDDITSFDAMTLFDFMSHADDCGIEGYIPFAPIIEKLIKSRNKMLQHVDAIMYTPVWAFGASEKLCSELFEYVDLWGELYNAVKSNYTTLKKKSPLGSKVISRAVVLLDTLFVRTPSEWKAIVLPLHPLYLWRYYEIFKTAKKENKERFTEDNINDIKETISHLPQVINVVVADSLITGDKNKILPNSGSIGALPTFENNVSRYAGSDGVQEFSEILERWVGFSPFSQNELRICAVDVPDFLVFLRSMKAFMCKPGGSRRIIIDAFLTRGQNPNNELTGLDYDGSDFQIGEFIKNGQLRIAIHRVKSSAEIKTALRQKPVHIAIFFDQSKYTVQYGPSQKNLYVTPLVVTYAYNYDSVTRRGTIVPSSDAISGIIGDYHRILENADIIETDMTVHMTYNETQDIADIVSIIQEGLTQWLVAADRSTEGFEPPQSIPIGERQIGCRMIHVWASSESRIIAQYIAMLCNYNLYPQEKILHEILRRYGHIASSGLISIPKFGTDSKAVECEKKGLLGTLFAAVKYTREYSAQIPIVASLDTDNARRWLRNSRFGNERADLVGMRYDGQEDTLYIDAIEVKTRDNDSDIKFQPDGKLGGHAAEQIAAIIAMLREIFDLGGDKSEDMFVTARREVLKYQVVSECFRKTHAPDSQEVWDKVFKRAFKSHPAIKIVISGLLYHFDLSRNSGDNTREYDFAGTPDCKITLCRMSTAKIQEEIFDGGGSSVSVPETLSEPEGPEDVGYALDIIGDSLADESEAPSGAPEGTPEDSGAEITADVPAPLEYAGSPETGAPPPKRKSLSDVRFLLGVDLRTQEKYYWEFGNKNLNNRHLLINGNSGCGKTYCIQGLLLEAVSQGISAVVFDYTGGFASGKLDPVFKESLRGKITQRIAKVSKIPINPFAKHDIEIDEEIVMPESDVDVAAKIASVFTKIYSLGDQQRSAVYSSVYNGLREYGDQMSFRTMAGELEKLGTGYAKSVLSKIQTFIDMDPFELNGGMDWGNIRDSGGSVYVIQLSGFDRDIQVLLTELLLWDIWSFSMKNGSEERPFILVMDEAQNLNHGEKSPSAKILTEGRKFGLSGWYATQFMKPQLTDDEIQRLQQAGQKLYFCPPDDGVTTVAKSIDISTQGTRDWAERLKKLKKGECVTCGSTVRNSHWLRYDPRVIKVPEIADRSI